MNTKQTPAARTIEIPVEHKNPAPGSMMFDLDNGHWSTKHVLNVHGKRHGLGGWTAAGTGRLICGGPLVSGPVAYSFGLCVVIDNYGGTGAESERMRAAGTEHVAEFGDVVRLDGSSYRIDPVPYNRDQVSLVPVSE